MRIIITICRLIVGVLFIFSGLVKANDPAGLSYKMHEFFEAWGMQAFNNYALIFAVCMIAFEIIAGLALLLGWYKKVNLYLLLLLIIFFTFLTGYALLAKNSDGTLKFKACGCFGDCIPLKPIQSFTKDIVLLVLILLLLWKQKFIQLVFNKKITIALMILGVVFSLGLQKYTLDYLPIKDCLSFKVGNNILAKKEYIPDSVVTTYFFNKEGKEYSFSPPNYPQWYLDEDSTYIEDTTKTIVKTITVGNNGDIIRDFTLTTLAGNDTTETLLAPSKNGINERQLFIITDIEEKGSYSWEKDFATLVKYTTVKPDTISGQTNTITDVILNRAMQGPPLFVVTNKVDVARKFFKKYGFDESHILFCDEKPLLAAARTRPMLMVINNSVIKAKISYKSLGSFLKKWRSN